MNESPLLFHTFLLAVAEMRRLQQQLTPGAPWGLRIAITRAEQEVDDLVTMHLMPPVLPFKQEEPK